MARNNLKENKFDVVYEVMDSLGNTHEIKCETIEANGDEVIFRDKHNNGVGLFRNYIYWKLLSFTLATVDEEEEGS